MGIVRNFCFFKFEVKVVEVRNVEFKLLLSFFFVRFYFYVGSNCKVELNFIEICLRLDNEVMIWN